MQEQYLSVLKTKNPLGYVDSFAKSDHVRSVAVFENRLPEAPLFTIVIPSYRRTETLREALESAICQDTDMPFEIIITDDYPVRGDEVETLMMQYVNQPNLSYYKNEQNLGLAGNWNRLVTLTRGKYLVMLHDDDVLAPYYIRTVHDQLKELPADTALLQTTKAKENYFDLYNIKTTYTRHFIYDNLRGYSLGALSGGTYRKDAIIAVGGWNQDFYPSLDWYLDIQLMQRFPVYKSDTIGLFYRWEDNLSLKYDTRQGFIYCDYALQYAILKSWNIPGCLCKHWLRTNLVRRLAHYKVNITDVKPLTLNKHKFISRFATHLTEWLCYRIYKRHIAFADKIASKR